MRLYIDADRGSARGHVVNIVVKFSLIVDYRMRMVGFNGTAYIALARERVKVMRRQVRCWRVLVQVDRKDGRRQGVGTHRLELGLANTD